MNKKTNAVIWAAHAVLYYVCPVCHWRCTQKAMFNEHMKDQHQLNRNQFTVSLPRLTDRKKKTQRHE